MKILLVEDDQSMIDILTTILVEQHYVVDIATDGEIGWEFAMTTTYDLILLDVMLPKLDGILFCRRLREHKQQVPVMLLTARDTTSDKLLGLDSGADDYVVKPFNVQELSARIRALLRRGSGTETSLVLEQGGLCLDLRTRAVSYQGRSLQFSRKAYLLLELFLRYPQRVFSRSAIIDQLWSVGEDPPNEDTIKSHIKNIRRELKAAGAQDLIETLYGQGYRLNPAYLTEANPVAPMPISAEQHVAAKVAEIWQRTKGASLERVASLAAIVAPLQTGTLSADQSQQAIQTAHKLAGSLGTFGFDAGSRLARQLEAVLTAAVQPTGGIPPQQQEPLAPQVETLVSAIRGIVSQPSAPRLGQAHEAKAEQPLLRSPASPYIMVMVGDRFLAQCLAQEVSTPKLQVVSVSSPEAAIAHMVQQRPEACLLDLPLLAQTPNGKTLCTMLATDHVPVPLILRGDGRNLSDRKTALNLGGQLFLDKTATPLQAFHALTEILNPSALIDATILAIAADPQILSVLESCLEPHELQVVGCQQLEQGWAHLHHVQPDLLILDLDLPDGNGLEVCQALRQDWRWRSLPIQMLTQHTEPTVYRQILAAGADDYLCKPIAPDELTVRVINRLRRHYLTQHHAGKDRVTGLANRVQATPTLQQLLDLGQITQQPVCICLLELDQGQALTEHDRAAQGDRRLQHFAQFLQQTLRRSDVVARWSSHEFMVGLYGLSGKAGVDHLKTLRASWQTYTQQAELFSPTATVPSSPIGSPPTFSAGIAEFPTDGADLQMLYRTADAALYQAKLSGRDRVLSST